MPNIISEHYTDELIDWNETIDHYVEEMDELEQKLEAIIRRNSIKGIAEKVEVHQSQLNKISDAFYRLKIEIEQQVSSLKTDSTFVDDTLIDNETEKRQVQLRSKMKETEKEYIDIKFDCYNFLSDTLKK